MAKITAEWLKSKNVPDDVAQEIISNLVSDYTDNSVIKDKYIDKTTYDTEKKNYTGKIDSYDKAIKSIQKLVGAEDETGIATAIGNLKETIKNNDKAHKAELQKIERNCVSEKLLSGMGAINSKAVFPFLSDIDCNVDIATYETMLKTQIEALATSEDTKFLFKQNEQQQQQQNQFGGVNLANKHNQGADGQNLTLEQQMALANK